MKRKREQYHTDIIHTVRFLLHAGQNACHYLLRGTDGFSRGCGCLEREKREEGDDNGPAVLCAMRG